LLVVGICFLFNGVLLFAAGGVRDAQREARDIGVRAAIVSGCWQALALLPGVSRSGTTISSAVHRRIRPDVATRFSFFLGTPAIAGAIVLEGKDVAALDPQMRLPLALGVATAFVTGLAAIALLLRIVRTGKLRYLAYYSGALATLVPR